MEQLLHQFEENGSLLSKLYAKNKPEKRIFHIKRKTLQIMWFHATTSDRNQAIERPVDVRDIKEIRSGNKGKLFEKWSDFKTKPENCFTILYGDSFRLKSLSLVGEWF